MTPAAQALDEDLRLLFDGRTIGNGPASERVFGSDDGAPRTVGESRDLYRRPIVEAFAASGAETLAEFPERVVAILADCDDAHSHIERLGAANAALNVENDRLRHERDMAKAEADRYHTGLEALRESEHKAKMDLAATRKAHADLTAAHAKAVAALDRGSLAEVEKSRQTLAARVAELLKENDELRRGIRRLCRILGKAMAGDL